jgi:hypothetical protein
MNGRFLPRVVSADVKNGGFVEIGERQHRYRAALELIVVRTSAVAISMRKYTDASVAGDIISIFSTT